MYIYASLTTLLMADMITSLIIFTNMHHVQDAIGANFEKITFSANKVRDGHFKTTVEVLWLTYSLVRKNI